MTDKLRGISFIIPAYNEEKSIVSTCERLKRVLSALGRDFEIIVVNDGSVDQTRKLAQGSEATTVINHPVNVGYGRAVKTGVMAAKYPIIGIVDSDDTYDIERLPDLAAKMEEGFDMAIAERSNVMELDRPVKRFFRKMLISTLSFVVSKKIKDPNSGFRLFTKELVMTFFPFLCDTFSFTTSITVFAMGEAFFVTYVPITYSQRLGRTKVRHFRDSLRMIQLVLEGIVFFNPLKFFILLIIASVFLVGLPAILIALAGMQTLSLYFLIVGVTALALFGMGVLGDIIRVSNSGYLARKVDIAFRKKHGCDS